MTISQETYERILSAGQNRVDQMRDALAIEAGPDGIIPLPAVCWGCDQRRYDIVLINGDGLPMCGECARGDEAVLAGTT